MEAIIAKTDRENRLIAAGTTIVFSALLLLLMLWITITSPIPPFEAGPEGIVLALGTDDFGMGNDPLPPPAANSAKSAEKSSQPAEAAAETKMLTSDVPENVTAPEVKNDKPNVQPVEQKPDQALLNAFNKQHTTAGTGTGHGDDETPGWKGDPNGSPNSNVYGPIGDGNGIKGRITGGRKMIGKVAIYDDSQETGIVAVEILVDRYGKIIKAEPVLIGSTTTSSVLWRKAKEGLLNQKLFNESASGEEARGTFYIDFTVR